MSDAIEMDEERHALYQMFLLRLGSRVGFGGINL
jgi:hypothetical protein